jgi:hypothetical protein
MSKNTKKPKYPQIRVRLVGEDGNAYSILGRITRAMRHHSVPQEEIAAFRAEATSGDYSHLLATCAKWVEVD